MATTAPPLSSVQMTDYVFCDICQARVNNYLRCTICQFGQFDVCKPCFHEGHWCPTRQHQLIEVEARSEKGRRDPPTRPDLQRKPESRYFTYDPLAIPQDAGPFIRLLTVHPNQPGEDPRADMKAWPLHEAPEYEALSYCWGTIQPISFMRLNNKRFAITPSLHKALSHIAANRTEPLTLWVDAICINQGDSTEKSQQVSLMRDIYEKASRTVVWLGPAEGESHLALTMYMRMLDLHGYTYFGKVMGEKRYEVFEKMLGETTEDAAVVEKRRQLFLRNWAKFWSDNGLNISTQDLENVARDALNADVSGQAPRDDIEDWVGSFTDQLYAAPPAPTAREIPKQSRLPQFSQLLAQRSARDPNRPQPAEIAATRALFGSPWFNRMWVVQETIMSKEVVFNYGTDSFPGWAIYAGLRIACDFAPELKICLLNFTTVWAFRRALCRHSNHIHEHEGERGKRDLMPLLKTFRTRNATNPRDKVYALLGITSDDSEKLGITIRYDRSIAETYTEAAIAIVKSTNDLCILNLLKPATELTPDLPSWVPDWADTTLPLEPLAGIPKLTGKKNPTTKYYASTADSSISFIEAAMEGRLTLSGYVCDIITEVGTVMPTFDVEADVMDKASKPCRPETMREKLIQTQRMYSRVRDRFEIYQAWEQIAHAKAPYPTGEDPTVVYKCTLQTGPDQPSHVTIQQFQAWYESLGTYYDVLNKVINYPINSKLGMLRWAAAMQEFNALPKPPKFDCTYGRRILRTEKGCLGLAPMGAEVGDSVILAKGGRTPVIAREKGEEWMMVGPAYVHGIMYGELWDEEQCQDMTFV